MLSVGLAAFPHIERLMRRRYHRGWGQSASGGAGRRRLGCGRDAPPARPAPASPRRPARRPDRPVRRMVGAGRGRGATSGRDLPRDGRRGRSARRQHGAAEGLRRRGLSLPHQLRIRQGPAARREPRAAIVVYWRDWTGRSASAAPSSSSCRRNPTPTSDPPPRSARRRVGVAAEPAPRLARRSSTTGSGRSRSASPARRSPGPGTGAASSCAPVEIEFWQGQVGRLHDRFRYARARARPGGSSGWGPSREHPYGMPDELSQAEPVSVPLPPAQLSLSLPPSMSSSSEPPTTRYRGQHRRRANRRPPGQG